MTPYIVYITRADEWAENDGREITVDQWLNLVRRDPELELLPGKGPCFAIWKPDGSSLDWEVGNIFTQTPSPAFLEKMSAIAKKLGGKVQGEAGEVYAGTPELNQVLWSLQALAQPAKVQMQLYVQAPKVARRLAVDFSRARHWLLAHYRDRLTPAQLQAIDQLAAAFDPLGSEPGASHWTDEALRTAEKWSDIRQLARKALAAFGWSCDEPPRG